MEPFTVDDAGQTITIQKNGLYQFGFNCRVYNDDHAATDADLNVTVVVNGVLTPITIGVKNTLDTIYSGVSKTTVQAQRPLSLTGLLRLNFGDTVQFASGGTAVGFTLSDLTWWFVRLGP